MTTDVNVPVGAFDCIFNFTRRRGSCNPLRQQTHPCKAVLPKQTDYNFAKAMLTDARLQLPSVDNKLNNADHVKLWDFWWRVFQECLVFADCAHTPPCMSAPVVKFENLDDEGDCVKGWFVDHPRLYAVSEVSCLVVRRWVGGHLEC